MFEYALILRTIVLNLRTTVNGRSPAADSGEYLLVHLGGNLGSAAGYRPNGVGFHHLQGLVAEDIGNFTDCCSVHREIEATEWRRS